MTNDELIRYVDQLSDELEVRDASDQLIEDVTRQVESHIQETGENPYDAFGVPGDYAQAFTPTSTMTRARFWRLVVASVIPALAGGLLLSQGIISAVDDRSMFWGINGWYGVMFGVLALLAWMLLLVSLTARDRQQRSQLS